MLDIRTVLAATDYSECARRAFDHARFAAQQFGAVLHVLHVVDSGPPGVIEHTEAERRISVRRSARSAAAGILAYADEIDADLIVMGTHGRRGALRLFMGSEAEAVVHGAACPVLTVSAGSLSVPGEGVSRILVPVDFSAVSQTQILHAQALADLYGASLDLLHIIEVPNASEFYRMDRFHSEVPSMAAEARQTLVDLAGAFGSSVPTRFHILVGNPARDILNFADAQNSDLIVIASHARGSGGTWPAGGVAEQVIRRAPIMVATLKAAGKSLVVAGPQEDAIDAPAVSKAIHPPAVSNAIDTPAVSKA